MATILVTGANRGIGLALVRKLLARGDSVIATARDPHTADDLAPLLAQHQARSQLLALDVTDEASIRSAMALLSAKTTALDVLVNNAGVSSGGAGDVARGQGSRLGMLTAAALIDVYRVNAVGALLVTQAAVELLRKGRDARVLNVSSAMGSIAEASGGSYAYRMSKAALNMASRALASDLRQYGIAVRSVHPGWVKTRMGGASAPIDVDASADGLVRLIDRTTLGESGSFVRYDGKSLEW